MRDAVRCNEPASWPMRARSSLSSSDMVKIGRSKRSDVRRNRGMNACYKGVEVKER